MRNKRPRGGVIIFLIRMWISNIATFPSLI